TAAPVSASGAPPAGVSAIAASASVAPPARSGTSAMKVVLIVVGIFAVFAVLGIASCVFVAWQARDMVREHVRVNGSGSSLTINTPQGEIKMGQRAGAGLNAQF